jgi:two-component system, OmpR family, sensor histidine kinase BaeS
MNCVPPSQLTVYHDGLFDGVADLGADTRRALTAQTDGLARLAEDIDDVSRAAARDRVLGP